METIESFAAESGHWYKPDGTPAYTIIGKTGKERATTLRDARTMGLYPSVTTITRVLAAPGLDNWKIDQAILASLTLTRKPEESDEAYIARIKQDAKQQAQSAAEFGTQIHGAIERHFRGEQVPEPYALFVEAATKEIDRAFGDVEWSAERSFCSRSYGYGGKVDLSSAEGQLPIIIDIKTKDGALEKVETYDDQEMQAAAYAQGIYGTFATTGNLFVSRTHPGVAKLVLHSPERHERAWEMFKLCLQLWKLQKGYNPCN